jgi:DNA-binding transcriptional LysR family regulator
MNEVLVLRWALAAAESGSFSRAAEQFRVKQSTLSKRVRFLELRLGIPIFERSTQGVAPTRSGARFLARARSIVEDLDHLSRDSAALAKGEAGHLRMGFHGSLAGGSLRGLIEIVRRELPEVELEAIEGNREQLLKGLDHGRLDIAIVSGAASASCGRSLCLWSEPLIIAMPASHPLLDRDPLYWTDLRGMAFLVTRADPGPLIGTMITARLAGPSSGPAIVCQAVSRDNLPGFATSKCLAVLLGAPPGADSAIRYREIHDAFGPTRLEQTLHWRDENDNPTLSRLLTLIAHRLGHASPIPAVAMP